MPEDLVRLLHDNLRKADPERVACVSEKWKGTVSLATELHNCS